MTGALDGRVVAITGAGRGIGREHALLMAAEGASVVVNDLGSGPDGTGSSAGPADEVVAEIEALGGHAVAHAGDVASADGAASLVTAAVDAYGRLDVLVNNAGILRDAMLVNMEEDSWDLSLRVNLRGTFLPAREAGRHWRARSKAGETVDAAIVNTSSESGVFANAGQSNYAAAKSAVATLTEIWHKELGRYGVRVNGILPRARTRLTDNDRIQPKEGRFDIWHPGNVSPFVAYLASTRCITSGEVFLVAGGTVQRTLPWLLDEGWKLKSDERWTVTGLEEAVAELGPPPRDGWDRGMIR